MSRSIYALLVGINHYKSPEITPLKGCINDVTAIEEFLSRWLTTDEDKLYIKKLIGCAATRQAIIDGFREHLCQAKSNDIALFYYSGHGSQEQAAEEFRHLEPDLLNETLVCWDSRTNNTWDLADKELAKLIAEVTQKNNPHIVVILDCCHSGGAVRGDSEYTGVRSIIPSLIRQRPLSSFIFSPDEINLLLASKFSLPKGEYIFLAACRDKEQAREHYVQERGVFSYFLIDSLQRNSTLTYRDLFKRTNALVRSFSHHQSPQLEATNSSYLDQPFLGGAVAKQQPYFTVTYHGNNGWGIDGGAVHGIVAGSGESKMRLAIFPIDVENLSQLSQAIAVAEITEVLPQMSKINIAGIKEELEPELTYKAVVTSLTSSCLKIYLDGEPSGIKFARQAIQTAVFNEQPSLYICEVFESSKADIYLQVYRNEYLIIRASDRRELISPIAGIGLESARRAIQALEHIARWINIATLSSPANSRIQANAVKMQIYQQNSEIEDYQIYLEYQVINGQLQPPAIQIKLTNTTDKALYCVLLNLTERFAVRAISFAGGQIGIWLEPGQEAWALEGKPISISIPQTLCKQGLTKCKDILKLIVSTADFDVNILEQDNIEVHSTRSSNAVNLSPPMPRLRDLNRLIERVQTRAIVPCDLESQNPEIWDDWLTREIMILTAIPQGVNLIKPDIEKQLPKRDARGKSDALSEKVVGLSFFKKIWLGLRASD